MSWQQFIFQSTSDQSDALTELLMRCGASSVSIKDAGDLPIFEPPLNTTPLWPDIVISALYEADRDLIPVRAQVTQLLRHEPESKIEILEDKDWVREWMDNFHPICFGESLWICPSWLEPPEPEAVNIMLDPGLAFGTGTHETTSLCLNWLDSYADNLKLKTVLDFGCGSGILAIAAHKLGASEVYAMDIDPQAIQATFANAEKNHISEHFTCQISKEFSSNYQDLKVDLVIANILSKPLIELVTTITNYLKPQGQIVLSGILQSQAQSVIDAYADMIDFDPIKVKGDWIRLTGFKR